MKSVISMIGIFIVFYIIAYSDILSIVAYNIFTYIAFGIAALTILAAALFLGTPISKPLIKLNKRGDNDDENIHLA